MKEEGGRREEEEGGRREEEAGGTREEGGGRVEGGGGSREEGGGGREEGGGGREEGAGVDGGMVEEGGLFFFSVLIGGIVESHSEEESLEVSLDGSFCSLSKE